MFKWHVRLLCLQGTPEQKPGLQKKTWPGPTPLHLTSLKQKSIFVSVQNVVKRKTSLSIVAGDGWALPTTNRTKSRKGSYRGWGIEFAYKDSQSCRLSLLHRGEGFYCLSGLSKGWHLNNQVAGNGCGKSHASKMAKITPSVYSVISPLS